jgi:uncharacterized protein (UPF0335 family)
MDDPVQGDQLKSFIERIERLEEEKKTISDDIKEVYAEAKANGYDVKVMRAVVSLRKKDANERAEFEAILDLYLQAVGDLADTPLGRAAAPGFSSRATMARSTPTYPERVSRPVQSRPGAEAGSAVRSGAPVSETANPAHFLASQDKGATGARPEQEAPESAGGEGDCVVAAQGAGFVAQTDMGEAFARAAHPAPAADEPINGLAEANAIAARAVQPAPERATHQADIDLTIPAFLRRTKPEAHHSFGEQA